MSLLPSAEAQDLAGYVRKFLGTHAGLDRLRPDLESSVGHDRAMWRRANDELGLTGLLAPLALGGSGADLLTLGVVFEELGRVLVRAPFLSTIGLATPALLHAADAGRADDLLTEVVSGTSACLAWSGDRPSNTSITWDGEGLSGCAPIVIDGADADVVLVAARREDAVVLVRAATESVEQTALPALDTTRRLARLDFDATPGELLGTNADVGLDHALAIATLLLAAEQVGAAQRGLEVAVEYAKTRVQFGQPIGAFQAVKHRCADMLVDVELSRSLVHLALVAVDSDLAVAQREAAIVGGFVGDAALAVAGGVVQVHGGIGFTWEHDAHLYLKRAKSSQLLFGSPTAHRRAAAALLGVAP